MGVGVVDYPPLHKGVHTYNLKTFYRYREKYHPKIFQISFIILTYASILLFI